jgi:type II secretory pathway pseudopilin PulG
VVDRQAVISQIGGVRGLVDSGLPIIVFITVNAFTSLSVAVWSALAAGAVLLLARVIRRENVQQAVSGFLGVAIAAFIARQTGEARDFFLPSLWSTAGFGLAFLVSAVIRWPLVGVVTEFMWPTPGLAEPRAWRSHRILMRTYTWLTLLWAAVYLLRIAVQGSLYVANDVTLLGTTRLIMGWPLTALEALLTVYLVRRVRHRISREIVSSPPAEPE